MEKIKYQCKNCGWETSIRQEWGDLRPKRCMNKKCNTSFLKHKDSLIITRPEPKAEVAPVVMAEEKNEKANRKQKNRSQSDE